MKINKILLALFIGVSLVACKEDTDEENPVISAVRINGATVTSNASIEAGTDMTLQINMTDNEELNQLKIDLHPNEDGHSHEEEGGEEADGEWEVLSVINLEGTSDSYSNTYSVPTNARGEWHLLVDVLDKEGNESSQVFVDIDVENDIIPLIEVTSVNGAEVDDEIDAAEGDVLVFQGTISDASGLADAHIEILDEDGNILVEEELEVGGAASFDMNGASITVPAFATDHLELHIHAEDNDGHEDEWSVELHND
ncbi:MAG: DUF4625 domain-containing protein [Flavobacteriales bacterium]|nr:DUF4625 domain-containing protein [Flavobacteriales bacterium]